MRPIIVFVTKTYYWRPVGDGALAVMAEVLLIVAAVVAVVFATPRVGLSGG